MDAIYDCLDKGRERMLRDAGIVLRENNIMAAAGSTPWRIVHCNVCFEDIAVGVVLTMDCGHCFCNDCEFPRSTSMFNPFICIDGALTGDNLFLVCDFSLTKYV
jgi:hypothetical protein